MRLFPQDTAGRITFFTVHNPVWAEHAAEIGSSPEAIAALAEKTAAARAAFQQQQAAQQAAQAATQALSRLMDDLLKAGADVVKEIRAKAASDGEQIYSLALIPPPKQPSPIPAPGKPEQITAELRQTGELFLQWKCKNPRGSVGTMYQISRGVGEAGERGAVTFLAAVGKKKFLDQTVPVGASSITYTLRAVRSTRTGPVATFTLSLGVSSQNPVQFQTRNAAA